MRFRLLLAALLCSTAITSVSAADRFSAFGGWGQMTGGPNNADSASFHALQRNGAIQAKQGKDAQMSGGSYSTTTAGVINYITSTTNGDGNSTTISGNSQNGQNSGAVKNQTQFNRYATNLGN